MYRKDEGQQKKKVGEETELGGDIKEEMLR